MRPAREGDGSVVIRQPSYVRLTAEGRILIACPECGSELEQLLPGRRLTLFQPRSRSARASSRSSDRAAPQS